MGKLKDATLANETSKSRMPDRFTYALQGYTVERRKDGWYCKKTLPSFAEDKAGWSGPKDTLQEICDILARLLLAEATHRHAVIATSYGLASDHPLHGLKKLSRKVSARR